MFFSFNKDKYEIKNKIFETYFLSNNDPNLRQGRSIASSDQYDSLAFLLRNGIYSKE